MNVELIAYTRPVQPGKNPMDVVEDAACICYNSKPTPTHRIATGCARSGHLSIYEHISFTFRITGVSRALLAQLTRHRHASFSVRSQRYCDESQFEYINPFRSPGAASDFDHFMEQTARWYSFLKEACHASSEDARAVLPNACTTQLVFTMNARALIEASHLRLCSRAQKEIRGLFKQVKEQVKQVCPEVAALMVPACEIDPEHPFCTEQRGSCGRHPMIDEVYKNESSLHPKHC